jgi:hypothetical protein
MFYLSRLHQIRADLLLHALDSPGFGIDHDSRRLQPRWDPTFSEHSYRFRPGRSA